MTAAAARARAVEASRLRLAVDEHGEGPPVLLIHGAGCTRSLWRETIAALGAGARVVAYDRRAYGDSEGPEGYRGTTVYEQAEDAAAVIRALGAAPAALCGHDVGALVALDLLLRHAGLARSAVLLEPPLFSLSVAGSEAVGTLREAVVHGAEAGGPAGAVEAYLAAVGGPATADRLGGARLEEARAAAPALAADLAAAPAWGYSRRELRAIAAPVTVLAGVRSAAARREAARSLAGLLGAAHHRELDACHFLPVEAPDAVAEAILGALAA